MTNNINNRYSIDYIVNKQNIDPIKSGEKRRRPDELEFQFEIPAPAEKRPKLNSQFDPIENFDSPPSPHASTAMKVNTLLPSSSSDSPQEASGSSEELCSNEHYKLGQNYLEKGDFKKAIHHLSQVRDHLIQYNGSKYNLDEINCGLGFCYLELNDSSAAKECLMKVSKSYSRIFYEAQYLLGDLALNLEQNPENALKFFGEIPSSSPIFADAQLEMAKILHLREQWPESIQCLTAARNSEFVTDKNINDYHLVFGRIMFLQMAYEHAMEHLKKVEPHGDNTFFIFAQQSLGECYFRLGKYDEAIKHFDICIKMFPEDDNSSFFTDARHEIYYHLGVCLEKIGKLREAISMLEKAVDEEGQYIDQAIEMLDELGVN
jgi:tetratricopeptide (TPR) repeat protein